MDRAKVKALELDGETALGSNQLSYNFHVEKGEHIVVIGQNGAGKSALLRILAGLLPLTKGTLRIDNQLVDAPESSTFLPPHKRSTVLQLQTGAVFPHLNVSKNIAYPLRQMKIESRIARNIIEESIERFELSEIRDRLPSTLSGGQLSRVALARSLAGSPSILLLDEPTSSIDIEASSWIGEFLKDLQTTLVLVSHNPVEALLIGNEMIVIDSGKIIQKGTPVDISTQPVNSWVAKFLNLNLLSATAHEFEANIHGGGSLRLAGKWNGEVHISFSSSAVSLYTDPPDGSPRNVWEATVSALHADGEIVRVGITGPFEATAIITKESLHHLDLRLGSKCWAAIKANELNVIPKRTLG
tara:strand:+ start:987 stop:2057 length:1071 start_codon:yes stop_codon:yes gene_type:complete